MADPSPYGALAYYGHILLGTLTILAALSALSVFKGGKLHRRAGYVFLAGLAIVCITSVSMLAQVFIAPLFMAVFTAAYAAAGAWLALRKGSNRVIAAEAMLSVFELVGLVLFLSIAIPAVARGIIPPFGPVVIASIPLVLLAGDANWFLNRHRRAELRIRRHLARMVWAFVVVIRAPLVELAAAGLPLSQPFVIFGPIALAVVMLYYFLRRYGGIRGQKPSVASSRSTADL
ncbi:MAG: hypothetical protein HKO08_10085 [Erythrobacter sp.]|nr:hypothetical protein [Erythrobacter sp.]